MSRRRGYIAIIDKDSRAMGLRLRNEWMFSFFSHDTHRLRKMIGMKIITCILLEVNINSKPTT